jgi:serine/threonine protein kinase
VLVSCGTDSDSGGGGGGRHGLSNAQAGARPAYCRDCAARADSLTLRITVTRQAPSTLCVCSCALSVLTGGELFDYVYKLDHLPEAEAAQYMQHLASFLAYAHSRHIVHR